MSRGKGARKPCDMNQARRRLVDARQFLEAAELLDAPDVVATCAIHAAIAAADAITCHALGELSLGEAACDARLDERRRQLFDAGRLDERRVVERVVLSQLGLDVAERAAEGLEL